MKLVSTGNRHHKNTVIDRRIDLVMTWSIDSGGSRFLDHLLATNNSLTIWKDGFLSKKKEKIWKKLKGKTWRRERRGDVRLIAKNAWALNRLLSQYLI